MEIKKMDAVCFQVVETAHKNILFYFHGPYAINSTGWMSVSPLLALKSEELKDFLQEWFQREITNIEGITYEVLKDLIKENASIECEVEYKKEKVIKSIVISISPDNRAKQNRKRLYINPKAFIPQLLRPDVLDPPTKKLVEEQKRKETFKKLFGEEQ